MRAFVIYCINAGISCALFGLQFAMRNYGHAVFNAALFLLSLAMAVKFLNTWRRRR